MRRIVIAGRISTVGPLSIAMPVADGGASNEFGNFPVMVRGMDEDGEPLRTGYLPATTLRGALRRGAVLPGMKRDAEAGNPWSLKRIYGDMIGQDASSEEASGYINPVEVQKIRDANPIQDLFGSGLGLASRLKVSHFLPASNILPQAFTAPRKDPFDNVSVLESASPESLEEHFGRAEAGSRKAAADQQVRSIRSRLRKAEREGADTAALTAELEAAEALVEKYSGQMGDMRSSTRAIFQHYALGAGLELHGKLVVDRARDGDLDILRTAFNELSRYPVLGAQSARGCGEIEGAFAVMQDGTTVEEIVIGGFRDARSTAFS